MSGSSQRPAVHPSKRDVWLVVVIWAASFGCILAGLAGLATDESPWVKAGVAVASLAVAGFMFWALYGISYTLTASELLIRAGPFRYRIPLPEIDSIAPSRNPLSSPAGSLDRLMIRWASSRKRVLISPLDKRKFIKDVASRCDHLEPSGQSLERRPDGSKEG